MKSEIEELFLKQLQFSKFPVFTREYRFDKDRKWRFDFAFQLRKIAVEIEGGTWINGRHNTGIGIEKDMEKYNFATAQGWKVYRFTSKQVKIGYAIAFMSKVFEV